MKMTTNVMPKEGQFVVIWKYNNKLWCCIVKWLDGVLYEYLEYKDSFVITNLKKEIIDNPEISDVQYLK